jgi:ornithine carbamoyltransferase
MNFISILDFTREEILDLLHSASILKRNRHEFKIKRPLDGMNLAMVFEMPSTRTRVSFEVAMNDLGGHAIHLNWMESQLGRGECIADSASVLSRYVDCILIRAKHETVCELAKDAKVPVINGLSDFYHPCQSLADLLTIQESKGDLSSLKFGWIGDGNNVCNSSILACALMKMKISVASPRGHEPNAKVVSIARKIGCDVDINDDPKNAAEDADILYTDAWVSMSDDPEKRLDEFKRFQIDEALLEEAKEDVIVMHCMPAHRGEEITDGVMDGLHSVIFDQAENRLHTEKALLIELLTHR